MAEPDTTMLREPQLGLGLTVPQPIYVHRAKDAGFSDPAFAANKAAPVHRWVPWIAGFSSNFVRDAFRKHLPCPGVVLDPFAGVGTTLVEALLAGHSAIGFEINPYAALACRTKLTARGLDVQGLLNAAENLRHFYADRVGNGYQPHSRAPRGFKTRAAFYSPKVLRKVLIIQDFIENLEPPGLQALFRLAFASTMVRYSNYSYEPSLGRRVSAGKDEIEDFPVLQTVALKLEDMASDIHWLKTSGGPSVPDAKVINDSFMRYKTHLSPSSVDLVVTSPPYLNNYHYNRNTRPQLYWLGYASQPADLHHLEHANFGKFWQTVREGPRMDIEFALPWCDIADRLEHLRSLHPEMGIYGGSGWANYASSYFNDCHRFAEGLRYVLKPGATALVVIGNSILHGIEIPTDQYFAKIGVAVGLELVQIHLPRSTRVGNSIIQSDVRVAKAHKSGRLYEAIVELRQP